MVSKSLLVVAAAAAASAFKIDPNMPDGVYTVDGSDTHVQIYNATASDTKRAADGFAQGDSTVYVRRGLGARAAGCDEFSYAPTSDPICQADVKRCSKQEYTGHADVDNANRMLADQLNAGTKATRDRPHVYSISGGIVAYFCILKGQGDSQGDSGSQKRALERISTHCGMYHPGDLTLYSGYSGAGGWVYGWNMKNVEYCNYGW